jgi:hypothetical protein
MNPAEIEAVLQLAFIQCEAVLCPLTDSQKQILRRVLMDAIMGQSLQSSAIGDQTTVNPLDELTLDERSRFLQFVTEQEQLGYSWKIQLLNDWLHNRESSSVQFIRDRYGPQWLNRVKRVHLAQYLDAQNPGEGLKLKIGDRIEVSNGLWEWVQDNGPCSREWFPCTVVQISQSIEGNGLGCNCVVRFDNGMEYEIQGIYEWNGYNWRWIN